MVDGLHVELDEERHFNRYRATTLDLPRYESVSGPLAAAYRHFCAAREDRYVASAGWGGYWTNRSSEAQFGPRGPPRALDDLGAARWKQRAYYDTMKDLASIGRVLRVSRIAIWDQVEVGGDRVEIGSMLDGWPLLPAPLRRKVVGAIREHLHRSVVG